MKNDELKKLIFKIAKTQDKVAFSDIFQYFAPRIIGYLTNSGSQREVAEEITQEALATVWQKAAQFNHEKGNVSTWIFTISRNKRIDKYRKNNFLPHNTTDLITALYPQENLENQDLEEKTDEIQSNLNENEKKLIKMNFFEGKTHKIISAELEIPLGTVKSKISSILNKLKTT